MDTSGLRKHSTGLRKHSLIHSPVFCLRKALISIMFHIPISLGDLPAAKMLIWLKMGFMRVFESLSKIL